jgi:hypothetical protein
VKSIRICIQNMRKWIGNSRIIVSLIVILLFTYLYTKGLWKISDYTGEKLSPYIFPFLTTYRYMKILYLFPVIMIFSDAPFIDSNQQFVMVRSGRLSWGIGQMLYIVVGSFCYTMFMLLSSIIVNIGHIQLDTSWGKGLILAATTNLTSALGIQYDTVKVTGSIVRYYTPAQAMLWSFVFLWMICTILGLIIYDLNILFKSNAVGVLVTGFMVFFTAIVDEVQQFMWFSPVTWSSLNNIDVAKTTSLPSFYFVLYMYSGAIVILFIMGALLSRSRRFSFEIKNNIQ